MKDISKNVVVDGKEYTLVFNLNVMEELQIKYGSLQKWIDKVDGKDLNTIDLSALKFGLKLMLNEGIDIKNESLAAEERQPLLTSKQVGRLINPEMLKNISNTVSESTEILDVPNA